MKPELDFHFPTFTITVHPKPKKAVDWGKLGVVVSVRALTGETPVFPRVLNNRPPVS